MIERWPAGTIGATVQPAEVALAEEANKQAHRAWVEVLKGTAVLEDFISDSLPYQHPDTLVGKKGVGIFREMMDRDDAVSSAISYLGLAALSTGREIVPASEDGADIEAADFATDAMNALKGSPNQMLLSILDSIGMGFSVGEIVWAEMNGPETDWPNKQWMGAIKPRNPAYIEFKLDEHDEIVKDGVWQLDNSGTYTKVDLSEVVYHVHDTRDGSPYGRTPSRRAYNPYFTRDGARKLWGRFMERYGVPTAWVKYPTNAEPADIARAKAAAKELRSTLSGAFDEGWQFELLEAKADQHKLFADAISESTRSIYRAYLVPSLVTESSEVGAYALGKMHNDQFIWILKFIRDSLMETVQTQIINPLIRHNFDVRKFPKFKFKPFAQEDLLAKANMAKILSETGVPLSVPKLRENFGDVVADADEEEENILIGRQPAGPVPEVAASEFTEIAWDAAHRQLPAQRTFSFAASQKSRLQASREADDLADSVGSNFSSDIAETLWGSAAGMAIADAAEILETQVGKGNGGRPQG